MKLYCPTCDCEQEIVLVSKKETYPVRGTDIEIEAEVCTCSVCETEIFDIELDDKNLEKAYRKYRKQKKLLFPEEIKQIREKYSLSQVQFARILGLGEKTIARYENGSLQDEAQNNLILLADDQTNFQRLKARYEDGMRDHTVLKLADFRYTLQRNIIGFSDDNEEFDLEAVENV